uniref:Ig-like domain-containing protein n=1 Tax=Strigamia maritima TaxID=126957 RepID=T1JKI5_STRMM
MNKKGKINLKFNKQHKKPHNLSFKMLMRKNGLKVTFDSEIVQVTGVLRGRAELPCDLSVPAEDQITLVLWYRNDSGIPIYSLDVRNSDSIETAAHLPADMLGNRAFLRILHPHAFLQLEPVKEQDEGVFKCRVDFKTSRTRNSRVNLTVIEESFLNRLMHHNERPHNWRTGSAQLLTAPATIPQYDFPRDCVAIPKALLNGRVSL